jgi:hypothetical protein
VRLDDLVRLIAGPIPVPRPCREERVEDFFHLVSGYSHSCVTHRHHHFSPSRRVLS